MARHDDDDDREKRPARDARARETERGEAPRSGGGAAGAVPEPTPEETPELLGERSDYPIAWEPGEGEDRER